MTQASDRIPTSKSRGPSIHGAQPAGVMDLRAATWTLRERVKELCCLYAVSEICDRESSTVDEILQSVVDVLPPGWQYPELCSARVQLHGREYRSSRFEQSPHVQTQPIVVHGSAVGTLEVFYAEERPRMDEGPFLHEERQLIGDVALRLGMLLESRFTQRGLDAAEARRSALLAVTRETILELDGDGTIHDLHPGATDVASRLAALRGTNVEDHRARCAAPRLIDEGMVRVRRVIQTGVPETYERQLRADGSMRDLEIRIVPVDAARVLVSIGDITERQALQRATAKTLERTQVHLAADLEACVCQELAGISTLAKTLAADLPDVVEQANELAERAEQALARSRSMAFGLHPTRLETDGLLPALEDLAQHVSTASQVDCTVTHLGRPPRDYVIALQLFRIASESIERMVRQRAPRQIHIELDSREGLTTLRIEAEGCQPARGFVEEGDPSLDVLRIQAASIGAALEVRGDGGLRRVVCSVAAE